MGRGAFVGHGSISLSKVDPMPLGGEINHGHVKDSDPEDGAGVREIPAGGLEQLSEK
jgi:hypothetical protein